MPRYNPEPAEDFYTPAEDVELEEVMDRVLVRYGKDPKRLHDVLNKLYTAFPLEFKRIVNAKLGRRVLWL